MAADVFLFRVGDRLVLCVDLLVVCEIGRVREMSEPAFCAKCMTVQPCNVMRSVGITTWTCCECGSVADEDFDYDYLEDFEEE